MTAMKVSAILVAIGGFLGVVAFFLPFVELTNSDGSVSISASQFVRNQLPTIKVANTSEQEMLDSAAGKAAIRSGMDEGKRAVENLKEITTFIIVVYAVPALLLLLGALGFLRQRFGRGIGFLCLLLGVGVLGIGALLTSAAEGTSGSGVTLLIPAGAAAAVGALIALVKPLRGVT
jgi:hypothetical protein